MRFKLLEKATHPDTSGVHVLLEAGTEIGDGTPYPIRKGIDKVRTALVRRRNKAAPEVPWFIPGHHMEPLDDEARTALADVPEKLTLENIPLTMEMGNLSGAKTERKAVGF